MRILVYKLSMDSIVVTSNYFNWAEGFRVGYLNCTVSAIMVGEGGGNVLPTYL